MEQIKRISFVAVKSVLWDKILFICLKYYVFKKFKGKLNKHEMPQEECYTNIWKISYFR